MRYHYYDVLAPVDEDGTAVCTTCLNERTGDYEFHGLSRPATRHVFVSSKPIREDYCLTFAQKRNAAQRRMMEEFNDDQA